jgi:diguanylate cyclase (GGDEF)-like protein/PAS domain S-box-containing protein
LPTDWRISYRGGLWLTATIGTLVSVAFLAAGLRIDAGHDRVRDDAARVAAASALQAQIDALDGQVRDLAGLFAASRDVEPGEYRAFTQPMLQRSGADALVFLLAVPQARRAEVERALGGPVLEQTPEGSLRSAARRDRYAVVTRATFSSEGRSLDGLDVLTLPGRREAIERAWRTSDVAAIGSLTMSRNAERGLAIFAPVRNGDGTSGIVVGSFSHRVLLAGIRRAIGPDVALRMAVGGTLIAGGAAKDRKPARVSYGGQVFEISAVAPPESGLPLGPLAFGVGALLTVLVLIMENALRTRRRLAIRDERITEAFEASPVGQGLGFRDGRFARVNVALCTITGLERDVLCTRTAVDLVHPSDRERAAALVARALAEPGVAAGAELRLLTADGGARWAQMHFTRLDDQELGSPLLTQVIDVSERRGLEVELRHQAEHDALTELLNRRGFQRRLGALLERSPEPSGAVMLIDLDHFKAVNDTLGHHVGDKVIHAAGAALRGSLRADDIVARIGGDEFAVLLPGADRERAEMTAERLVHAVTGEARAVDAGAGHSVSASIGVVMLDESFATADEALMAADLAMYDAKHAGRRRTAFYDGGATSSTQTRLQWVDRIRTALAQDRLALVAQPIVDLDSGRLVHHEILLRMLDPQGEHIAPGAFLPIAEQFGLMADIDRWVVTRAIGALAANPDRELVFEINLSGGSVGSPQVLETIRAALAQGGVAPSRVIFEITETTAVTNLEEAYAFASELAALGCRFALDDFGVGFGSFTYVKHLPFDFLKIDGEFVRNSATSAEDRVILESLIHAARGLGKRTIAEYVEDERTVTLLRELGVDMVQGFYTGRPRDLALVIEEAPRSSSRSPATP